MDKIFNKPFAINGARVNIPENGTENERVSFDKGFTQPYEVEAPSVDNPNGQGFNILRPEINEALYQLSNACNILAENIDKWTALTTENLNDIKQAGRYYQQNSGTEFVALNYPANKLGFLIVLRENPNIHYITQIYKAMAENIVYFRYSRDGGATWADWDSLVFKTEFDTKITQLQNTDTNLNNNKEDKTKIHFETKPQTTNWDEVIEQGLYYKQGGAQTGAPSDKSAWVSVYKNGNNDIIQIFNVVASNDGKIYKRQRLNGSWTSYEIIAFQSFTEATYRKIADSYTKAEVDNKLIGINQSWQKPSRSNNTEYTNNTGKPIMVAITFKSANEHAKGTCDFYVNNLIIASEYQTYIHVGRHTFSFIVPNGAKYKVNCTGNFSIYLWAELR